MLLERRDKIKYLMQASALENAGYYSDAAVVYRQLRAANPDDMRFTKHLAWLYARAGLSAAFDAETKKIENGK